MIRLHELSVQSRALSKEYFTPSDFFPLPLGHPTVAFTETQLYHLFKILTNETVSLSYTTMEKMVLDALKGRPTVKQSRTDHFRASGRAQTPGPGESSEPSLESLSEFYFPERQDITIGQEIIASCDQSDGATEMALISASFKKPSASVPQVSASKTLTAVTPTEEFDSSGTTSPDVTLFDIREQTRGEESQAEPLSKKVKRSKRARHRFVPMREEPFRDIGWTRSFISGPADPIHKPFMVWCHIGKRNFSIKPEGTLEILRHHLTEKHLRRDQRWHYEHLKSVDSTTGKIQHRVRGRDGKIQNKLKLSEELPKFIHAKLVDIGERFPFYEGFMQGHTTALVTPEARTIFI